ncbi:MAG: hypothetical protein H7234_06185 [Herminiimonas sp.]|nr:hypothetical protein [Herminiimonas sp.]
MRTISIIATVLLGVHAAALAQRSIDGNDADSRNFGASVGVSSSNSSRRSLSSSEDLGRDSDVRLKIKTEVCSPGPSEPPVMLDATGKVAGLYVPSAGTVILRLEDAIIAAAVTNQLDVNTPFASLGSQSGSTYRWTIQELTWFLSTDCTGPPIPLASAGLRPVAYTQDRRSGTLTAYIGGSGRSAPRPANSVRQPTLGSGPLSGQCSQKTPFGGVIEGFDVAQTVVLSQRFPEPLTVR